MCFIQAATLVGTEQKCTEIAFCDVFLHNETEGLLNYFTKGTKVKNTLCLFPLSPPIAPP